MRILIICGSRRKNSYTRKLTDIAFEHCKKKDAETHYLDIGKEMISEFRGFGENYGKETLKWVQILETADALIIGSPIYNGLISSGVKNFFEFPNYKLLEGASAGFIIKSSGAGAQQQARGQLTALMNYFNVNSNPRAVFSTDADFEENGKLKNQNIEERIKWLVDSTIKTSMCLGGKHVKI